MPKSKPIGAGLILSEFGDVPHVGDYFDLWAVYERPFRAMVDQFNAIADLRQHIAGNAENARRANDASRVGVDVDEQGIAIVFISGPTSKAVGSLQEGTSTVRVRQQLRAVRNDPAVKGVILAMDTPGGTVKGNRDLADEVAALDREKPVFVYVEDLAASAGVSVASQGRRIFVNQASALYGAMGTYSVICDQSKAADKLGVVVHVVKAGEFKGMGTPGTEVTPDQLAELQRTVDQLNESYLELIARGRDMSIDAVRQLADGRIHTATQAQAFGLVDGVQSFEATYSQLLQEIAQPTSRSRHHQETVEVEQVDDETTTNTDPPSKEGQPMEPATLAELKEAFPNASAEFYLAQLEANATIVDAAKGYGAHLDAEAKATADAAEAKAKADREAAEKNGGLGHRPLSKVEGGNDYEGGNGDPVEDFNDAVAKQLERNGGDLGQQARFSAIRAVAKRRPDLHQAYLLACNGGRKAQRQLLEKFEEMGEVAKAAS